MNLDYQLAGGSTIGSEHRVVPRNNQDSWTILTTDELQIGVVTDGCTSGIHSEVGAKLGARLVAESVRTAYTQPHRKVQWQRIQQSVISEMDILARAMGGNYKETVQDFLLFTIVGVVIKQNTATFFSLGDGTIVINSEINQLGPFPGNAPPYLGYGLLEGDVNIDSALIRLQPFAEVDTSELESFLIACDGIDDLIASEGKKKPGLSDKFVEPISQFWESDRYFGDNPELISRDLKLIGRDFPVKDPERGLLHDDTTLIVGRRIPVVELEE